MTSFRYTHAIVCRLPDSLYHHALANQEPEEALNLEVAREQHSEFVGCLRKIGLDVIELPADEAFPDCPFIEDIAIVLNGTAFICRPRDIARRGEADIVKFILRKELGLSIVEILDPDAVIDGADVLFTGKEFFVGISSRTNEAGARALAAAFPEYVVSPVIVRGPHQLRNFISMGGPSIIIAGNSEYAKEALREIWERAAYKNYKVLTVPEDAASNCVFANGTLLHRPPHEFPISAKVIEDRMSAHRHFIKLQPASFNAIAHLGRGRRLSSAVILIQKKDHIKYIPLA